MTEKNKLRGKKARASGQRFELKVRKNLESKGWVVDKWSNNVNFDFDADKFYNVKKGVTGILIPAKSFMGRSRNNGFPDFFAFKLLDEISLSNKEFGVTPCYEVIGVEVKSNGYLNKTEKEKCVWYLKNNVFSRILIAQKSKKRGEIVYKDFRELKEIRTK